MKDTKYIFVTGGVTSSLGKGIIAASLGKLLQARGFKVTNQKLDPYINVDPGTLNPYEHGECYVTVDGHEADLDLGHYERFLGVETHKANNITTGRIYQNVINKERRGDFFHTGVPPQLLSCRHAPRQHLRDRRRSGQPALCGCGLRHHGYAGSA